METYTCECGYGTFHVMKCAQHIFIVRLYYIYIFSCYFEMPLAFLDHASALLKLWIVIVYLQGVINQIFPLFNLNLNFEPKVVSIHIASCFTFLWLSSHSVHLNNGILCSFLQTTLVQPHTATTIVGFPPWIIPLPTLIQHLMKIHWGLFGTLLLILPRTPNLVI